MPSPDRSEVPPIRVRLCGDGGVNADGRFVLYWMTANRRLEWNFALDRAMDWALDLDLPLVLFEPLRVGYRWASTRFHRFVIDGMEEHLRRLSSLPIEFLPFVEREEGQGKGLLHHLASQAAVVIGDEYPAFFLPRMVASAVRQVPCRFELVDSNGILPIHAPARAFTSAYAFRRYLQAALPEHLGARPRSNPDFTLLKPLSDGLDVPERWSSGLRLPSNEELARFPIDQTVGPVAGGPAAATGGIEAARTLLADFLSRGLAGYPEDRRHPDRAGSSQLSSHLHWGHISGHEVVHTLLESEGWTPLRLGERATGKRAGWWGTSAAAEAFLDQVITWRELGFNTCVNDRDYDRFESLPDWARQTMMEHAEDPRPHLYTLDEFERAGTHDPLWNAAQNQLRTEGRIHNYLRMLWGKKILEWSPDPRRALDIMIELNNKYSLDGRDPNSYSGIFWTLGRYDRGWPERAVFGKIRSMTSASTRRKVEVSSYLEHFSEGSSSR